MDGRAEELDYSKGNIGKTLESYMTVNLLDSGVPFHSALAEVQESEDEVMARVVMDVLPKYKDLNPAKPENLRILFLALEGVGEATQKAAWKSKYFKLTISSPIEKEELLEMTRRNQFKTERLDYLFYTSDCRKFRKILKAEGKARAAAFGLGLAIDAKKRAERMPDDW